MKVRKTKEHQKKLTFFTKKNKKKINIENMNNVDIKSQNRLSIELIAMSILPIIIVVMITCIITWQSFTKNSRKQIESDLYTAATAVVSSFEQNAGEYFFATLADNEQGDFWKGGYNISRSDALLDRIKYETGIDITIVSKKGIIITTALDEKTGERKNIEVTSNLKDLVFKKGYPEFNDNMKIDGVEQFMYAMPIAQIDQSEVMAMIIVSTSKTDSMKSTYVALQILMAINIVIMIGICIFIVLFTRGITRSLKAGFNALDLLSKGDLRIDSNMLMLKRKDEIGDMNRSIYTFSTKFRKLIANSIDTTKDIEDTTNDLDNTAESTKSSVAIVDTAMENMTEAANQQARIVVEVNNDMNVLGDMIRNTYSEIKSINEYNVEMQDSSRIANKIVSELTYIRESLNSVIEVINKQTGDTHNLTKDIRKYAEMIASFADETNLLALNASIEAARVGENGKGFAIVANQIQSLADQSAIVSNDITNTVNLLFNDSKKSLNTMEQVNTVIEKLNANIDDTKEIFNAVNEGISYSADGLQKIQDQTKVIDNSRSSMMKVMEELEEVSKQNIKCAADTGEVTKHIANLFDEIEKIKEVSEKLVESTKVFEV